MTSPSRKKCSGIKSPTECTSPCKWASGTRRSFCRFGKNSRKASPKKSPRKPPPAAPCTDQAQRLPKWKAVQRSVPNGTVLTETRSRYVLGPSPCALATSRQRGQKTRCFSPQDNRSKRKQCTLLSPSPEFPHLFPSGLHLSGVGVLHDRAFTCDYKDNVALEDHHASLEDPPDPYIVTVLGPFPHVATDRLMILCTATVNFLGLTSTIDPLSFATVFTTNVRGKDPVNGRSTNEVVRYVPTLEMLRDWSDALKEGVRTKRLPENLAPIPRAVSDLVSLMETQFAHLEDLRRECSADLALRSTARTMIRNLFTMAMYARRWQGPGTAYPIQNSGKVGSQRKPVAESIQGKYSAMLPSGAVRISEHKVNGNYAEADFVNGEGRLEILESQHLHGAVHALRRLPQAQQNFLEKKMRATLETVYCVDGTFWPCHELTLMDLVNLVLLGLNDDRSCLRRNSMHIATTCRMLCPYVYSSEPTWIKYEGLLRRLDVTGH